MGSGMKLIDIVMNNGQAKNLIIELHCPSDLGVGDKCPMLEDEEIDCAECWDREVMEG